MADKGWTLTNFSSKGSVILEVHIEQGVVEIEVVSVSMTYTVNDIPTASCLVPMGRDVHKIGAVRNELRNQAAIHRVANQLKQFMKARIIIKPEGEFITGKAEWPDEPQVVFEGYVTGIAVRKSAGKVNTVIGLTHWLIDLAFSSALNGNSHPANPTQLSAAAILQNRGVTGAAIPVYLSELVGADLISSEVSKDLWAAVKSFYCALAKTPARTTAEGDLCLGGGDFLANDRALNALSRIEGPAKECPKPDYKYGAPLALNSKGLSAVEEAVTRAITRETVQSFAHTTLWDKLIATFHRLFSAAIVPMADRALVIADTPALRGDVWRTILNTEYHSFDQNARLDRPLRAVGIFGRQISQTGAALSPGGQNDDFLTVGGCFVADSVAPGDGIIQYLQAPPWLSLVGSVLSDPTNTQNLRNKKAGPSATQPGPKGGQVKPPSISAGNELYNKYAQAVYVATALRGRNGLVSGKLRFDIAPGSNVRIKGAAEKFIGGEDDLSTDIFANVFKVTIIIDAEGSSALTNLQLTHIRTEKENESDRTSVEDHPLFGDSNKVRAAIHGGGRHGSPIVEAYAFE